MQMQNEFSPEEMRELFKEAITGHREKPTQPVGVVDEACKEEGVA